MLVRVSGRVGRSKRVRGEEGAYRRKKELTIGGIGRIKFSRFNGGKSDRESGRL